MEQTTTVERKAVVANEQVLQLSPDAERDLTAGVRDSAGGEAVNAGEAVERLEEQLEGSRQNAERQEAWIRRIVPGRATTAIDEVPIWQNPTDDGVAVEYLLPSGDTFWRAYTVPTEYWEDDNEFARLLEATATPPSELDALIGSRVELEREGTGWSVQIDESSADDGEEHDEGEASDLLSMFISAGMLLASTNIFAALIGGMALAAYPVTEISDFLGLATGLLLVFNVFIALVIIQHTSEVEERL